MNTETLFIPVLRNCIYVYIYAWAVYKINIPKIPPVAGLTQTGRCTLKKTKVGKLTKAEHTVKKRYC